jgi:hypothetical protein
MALLSTDQSESNAQCFLLQEVRKADHPALVRAVAEILRRADDASAFSSFTSHSSSVED